MRIAYLILCHIDPEHISRLARKITENTSNAAFVHVDAKQDIAPFRQLLQGQEKVYLLENRTDVRWGGFSAIEATINLIRYALNEGDFDRFVLLQGLEYPILSNQAIDAFFEKQPQTEFLLAQNISKKKDWHEEHKYRLFWDLDNAKKISRKVLHRIYGCILKTKKIPKLRPNYVEDKDGRKLDIFQGGSRFAVTADAARYFVEFYDSNPGFNRYFKHVYAVDESYFHTVLYNSPYVKNTPDGKAVDRPHLEDFKNLTYFEYPVQATLFTSPADWPKLKNSGYLYFRKASSESRELLDLIDREHMAEECRG